MLPKQGDGEEPGRFKTAWKFLPRAPFQTVMVKFPSTGESAKLLKMER